jgi:hypothetical protein
LLPGQKSWCIKLYCHWLCHGFCPTAACIKQKVNNDASNANRQKTLN